MPVNVIAQSVWQVPMHRQKYRAFTLLVLVLHKEVLFLGRHYKASR